MKIFILFPGFGCSEKEWEYKVINKNKKYIRTKIDFLEKLKKLGKVYTYTPKIHDIMGHYWTTKDVKQTKKYSWFFKKPVPITLDDINIDKECKRIYQLLTEKYKKDKLEFIPIGHSIGSHYALHFSNLYPSKCLKMIFLDGTFITSELGNNLYKNDKQRQKIKSKDITNTNLKYLFDKMIENLKENRYKLNKVVNKYIDKMMYVTFAHYYQIIKKELNGKVKVPLISFRRMKYDIDKTKNNLKSNKRNMKSVKEEEELYKQNSNKVQVHYLINSSHYPFTKQRYSDQIIEEIKKSLQVDKI
jgi:pimeloyl-ACP methyl ester carboxylesterase